jgi:hypothetical protein
VQVVGFATNLLTRVQDAKKNTNIYRPNDNATP